MTKPILPSYNDVIAAALQKLIEVRPTTFEHVNWGSGAYATILAGLGAQAALAISRLADGVNGSTLLSSGEQLKAYVASEFKLPPSLASSKAVGVLTLDRTTSVQPKVYGVIKKGHKFVRDADATAVLPITGCQYEVGADVVVAVNQNTVTVPIVAIREGSDANLPKLSTTPYAVLRPVDALFDKNLAGTSWEAGGGSDGLVDADIIRFAKSYTPGQYGPTNDALALAALSAGVPHYLIDEPINNILYIADRSWGGSAAWAGAVLQSITDSGYFGYAGKISVAPIVSTPIKVSLTVRLRDPKYLSDTTEIQAAVQAAVQGYLDDRVDFNQVSVQPLRAFVSRAHRRILNCSAASILDMNDVAIPAPSSTFFGHYALAHNSISVTYLGPT